MEENLLFDNENLQLNNEKMGYMKKISIKKC